VEAVAALERFGTISVEVQVLAEQAEAAQVVLGLQQELSGTANTGGGGGGGGYADAGLQQMHQGGTGGSGIVILKYEVTPVDDC
jgi:hypothetical protein